MSYEHFGKLDEQFKFMHINQKSSMITGDEKVGEIKSSGISSHGNEFADDSHSIIQKEKLLINEDIVKLLNRTKYPFKQEKSQRLYGPPPNWNEEIPARGCEVFIGHIPRDCFEPELVPIFEKIGKIYQFRLMVESENSNKGYGFCVYTNKEDAKRAVAELNNFEIRKGKCIGVCFSVDNCRLFVGGIPKDKTREEILEQMIKITDCVKDVISYPSINDKTKNRGFAFVEYTSHKAAAMARRKLHHQQPQLWGQNIHVDWAEPEREVNEDTMSKVKILFVRNLMVNTTEDKLREIFLRHSGSDPLAVERVKKLNDFAFIHFKERDIAEKCLYDLNNSQIDGSTIEITWAKPAEKSGQNLQKTQTKLLSPGSIMSSAAVALANGSTSPDLTSYFMNSPNPGAINLSPSNTTLTNQFLSNPVPNGTQILNQNALSSLGFGLGAAANGRFPQNRPGKRNAAGSRSIGSQRDRKHPVEKLQKTQINPFANFELLDEISKRNGYGVPQYEITPCYTYQECDQKCVYSYYGSVHFPLINMKISTPNSYCNQETARNAVAELALLSLMYSQSFSYPLTDVFSGGIPFGISYLDSMTNLVTNPIFSQTGQQIRCDIQPPQAQQNQSSLGQINCKSPLIPQFPGQDQFLDNSSVSLQPNAIQQMANIAQHQHLGSFYPGMPGTSAPNVAGSMQMDYLNLLPLQDHLRAASITSMSADQTFQPASYLSTSGEILKLAQSQAQLTSASLPSQNSTIYLPPSAAESTKSLSEIQ